MESTNLEHHKRFEYCHSRLQYRSSKLLTAVKVYSVASESCNLLVFGVPKINLQNELKRNLEKYGSLELLEKITDSFVRAASQTNFQIEQFTDIYHAKFKRLEDARRAKRFYDARNFYGGILHISYGCEFETCDEIRKKLAQRKREVKFRIKLNLRNHNEAASDLNEPEAKRIKLDT